MADVSKLSIHEPSNVEQLILLVLVTKMGNENSENWFISNSKYKSWQNWSAEYRKDKTLQNCLFLKPILVFQIEKF